MTGPVQIANTAVWASRTPTPLRILRETPWSEIFGVDAPVDDEHRSRLGGEFGPRPLPEIAAGLGHADPARADPENPVRLHVEIAGAVRCARVLQLLPVLDVEADGRQVVMIHAAIHGERETAFGGVGGLRQPVERPDGRAVRPAPERPQPIPPHVDLADDVVVALLGERPAWLGLSLRLRPVARAERREDDPEQSKEP